MAYFLRFTETAKKDLKRATSLHHTGYDKTICNKARMAELLGCDASSVKLLNGLYVQVLDGLCGYLLEAETLEEALEEVENNTYQFEEIGKAVIFTGRYSNDSDLIPDGDLFLPYSIAKEL